MTTVAKNILNTYSKLFEGLDVVSKKRLLSRLNELIDKPENPKENAFYKSFGVFPDDKSGEEIIAELRSSRTFRERDIQF